MLIRKVDQGLPVDVAKIGDAASTALGEGNLDIARADAALTIAGGQIHLANTLVHGAGADVAIAGNLELADRTLDARLTLSGPASPDMSNVGRPELSLALKGSITAAKRTLDVSALTGWLVLRSVDRQTQRLEAIESDRHEQDLRSAVPPAVPLPALPPPIEVKPVPSNASTGNAAHTAPRKTTGQSTPPPKSAVESEPPPAPSPPKRSLLDSLFGGTQR